MLNSAAGVYWRICLYDACYFAFWLCLSGREHANLAAKYHLDQSIRHFTDITKQIYLKDASFDIIWHSLWPLLVITATTGSAAYGMFRRKIA